MPFKTVSDQDRKNFVEKGTRPQVSYLKTDLPVFVPQDGENTIRILPALEEDEHANLFGVEIWHYFINNRTYVSPRVFTGKHSDPVSEKFFEVRKTDEAAAQKYRGTKRFIMHILDYSDANNPVLKIWPAPISLVDEIIAVSQVTRTGQVIPIEHPTKGRKIYFRKQGSGMNTRYCQMLIDDEECPIDPELSEQIKPFKDIIKVDSEEVLANLVKSIAG